MAVMKNLALALCLIGALALAGWSLRTPAPLPADAPTQIFSAGRAMVDDRVIARVPHPMGSAENAAARDYLVQRMTALGLSPQVQRTLAFQRAPRAPEPVVVGGIVENIVGVLPGRDRATPALAIMAHYDSVPASPGAADDAAGVSAALEVMRILKAEGTPARDVILLLTDGEEAGLLGATGFFRDHPLARHVGFVINMESRGGGGQAQMFQTGAENGEVIKLLRKTAVHPAASSLAVYLYEHLPNDTDFTVSKAAGLTGLNYAFIGRQFDYHSPTSTPDNLDQGSLQHMGEQVLAQARAVAQAQALPGKAPNLVYANTFGSQVLAYPQLAGWAVLLLAVGLGALGAWRAQRRGALAWTDVVRGMGAALYLVLTAVALLRLARRITGAGFGFFEQRGLLAQVGLWEIAIALIAVGITIYAAAAAGRGGSRFHAALLAAVAGAACSAFGLDIPGLVLGGAGGVIALFTFGKPGGLAGTWTGVLATALLVAVGLQTAAAPTAFLVAWPLTIAAAMGAVSAMGSVRGTWLSLVLAVPAAVATAWVLSFAHGVFLGLDLVELLALFAWLSALTLWPLAQIEGEARADHRLVALAVILLGFGVTAAVRLIPPWSERHPRATYVTYVQDLDSGKASRVALLPDLSPWSEGVLKADGGAVSQRDMPLMSRRPVWRADAPPVAVAGPVLTLTRDPGGALQLAVVPPPGARSVFIDIRSKEGLTDTTINGRPTPLFDKPGQWTRLGFVAVPQGFTVGFRAAGAGEIETRYLVQTAGWPAQATPLPPRDAKTMAFDMSDSTTATGSRRFTW
jgi:hypothetical protein